MRKKLRESPTNLPASASVVEVVTVSDDDMSDSAPERTAGTTSCNK